jgi:hypothetical protein
MALLVEGDQRDVAAGERRGDDGEQRRRVQYEAPSR